MGGGQKQWAGWHGDGRGMSVGRGGGWDGKASGVSRHGCKLREAGGICDHPSVHAINIAVSKTL